MTSTSNVDYVRLRGQLVDELTRLGVLRSPAWRRAFERVPRHAFVPRFYRPVAPGGGWELVDGSDPAQEETWAAAVYSNDALITQVNSGQDAGSSPPGDGTIAAPPTSSSSQPSLMAAMLEALDLTDADQVLEVETGTGYNAALLCERLASRQVVTIDVDPGLVEQARARLAACGYTPLVAAADGAQGYPDRAPYTRLLATCSVVRVPAAWIQQVTPGGLILTALHRGLGGFGLLRLQVQPDGSASGPFLSQPGAFMPLRPVALPNPLALLHAIDNSDPPSRPALVGHDVLNSFDPRLWLALRLPCQVVHFGVRSQDGSWQRYLLGTDGSWTRLTETADGDLVQEGGPRRLWSELERAYQEWQDLGSPPRERLGLTVDATGQHTIWLDTPTSPHRWALPTT